MKLFPRNFLSLGVGGPDGIDDILDIQRRLSITDKGTLWEILIPSYSFRAEGDNGILEVELPGARIQDIDIEIDGPILTVTAKRSAHSTLRQTSPQPPSRNSSPGSDGKKYPLEGLLDYPSSSSDDSGDTDKTVMLQNGQVSTDQSNPSSAAVNPSQETSPPTNDQPQRNFIVYKCVFALDNSCNPEQVKALNYEDGVLSLYLGKGEKHAPRKIDIQ